MKTYKRVTQEQVHKRSILQEHQFKCHQTFLLYKAGACFDDWSAKIYIKYPKDGAGKVFGYMRINANIDNPVNSPLQPREEYKDPLYMNDRVYILSASCRGYGYCKTSTVLSSLFEQVKFPNVLPKWNASGRFFKTYSHAVYGFIL